jgi:predicted XRE-type DNA-binding protein
VQCSTTFCSGTLWRDAYSIGFFILKNNKMEIFKDVKGYEGFYQVSNLGNVRSLERKVAHRKKGYWQVLKERILKPGNNGKGYLYLTFRKEGEAKNQTIHRLVANAFLDNPENKRCVNHKDGNKLNNKVSNLEWNTHIENMQHAYKTGLRNQTGEKNHSTNLKDIEVCQIKDLLNSKRFYQREIGKFYGVTRATITGIARGKTWKHI